MKEENQLLPIAMVSKQQLQNEQAVVLSLVLASVMPHLGSMPRKGLGENLGGIVSCGSIPGAGYLTLEALWQSYTTPDKVKGVSHYLKEEWLQRYDLPERTLAKDSEVVVLGLDRKGLLAATLSYMVIENESRYDRRHRSYLTSITIERFDPPERVLRIRSLKSVLIHTHNWLQKWDHQRAELARESALLTHSVHQLVRGCSDVEDLG